MYKRSLNKTNSGQKKFTDGILKTYSMLLKPYTECSPTLASLLWDSRCKYYTKIKKLKLKGYYLSVLYFNFETFSKDIFLYSPILV